MAGKGAVMLEADLRNIAVRIHEKPHIAAQSSHIA
jgi:hypothetical protein